MKPDSGISGVLILNKPCQTTSHDMVNIVRRLYDTRRVGHTGTLDPDATGLLILLIGNATKAAEYLSTSSKKYRAILKLGLTTDTEDLSGNVLTTSEKLPSQDAVFQILPTFRGEISQIPPMYSALKVNGKKLVDLARKGKIVERESRSVTIFSLKATPLDESQGEYELQIHCSKGTYIRTLCADIGKALGCGGVMKSLIRTESNGFSLENSFTREEIEKMTLDERRSILLETEHLFSDLDCVNLPPFFERLAKSGAEIYEKKIGVHYECGTRLRLYGQNGFFSIGEVRNFPEGNAIKPIKQFLPSEK